MTATSEPRPATSEPQAHDASSAPAPALSPAARLFLEAPRFAVVGSVNADGSPHQAVAWYLLEGGKIVVNSAEGRHWPANLRRDHRVSITVAEAYAYVELRGEVEVDDDKDRAQSDIAAMARRYHADDPEHAEQMIEQVFRPQMRVSFRLRPTRVYEHLG